LEKLAPVGQFLVLFALFTAGGTFVMSNRRAANATEDRAAPMRKAPALKQTLEPAARTDLSTIAAPSALGPLGAQPRRNVERRQDKIDIWAPADVAPSPLLAGADGGPLPQVKTTEPLRTAEAPARSEIAPPVEAIDRTENGIRPPAIARLPGVIFEAPRQAYHDNNEPGLH
jgi:hypothetical protein